MYFRFLILFSTAFSLLLIGCANHPKLRIGETMNPSRYENMKEMFQEMVVKKDATLIPKYYHPDFLLMSNGQTMDYAETVRFHKEVYKTPIQYRFHFEPETVVEQGDRVAFRVFITTEKPPEPARKIEVILIGQYKDGKIYRVWELTYPDWSKLPAFTDKK